MLHDGFEEDAPMTVHRTAVFRNRDQDKSHDNRPPPPPDTFLSILRFPRSLLDVRVAVCGRGRIRGNTQRRRDMNKGNMYVHS